MYIEDSFYESISEASEITGITRKTIRERCHSDQPRFASYRWADASSKIKAPDKVKIKGWQEKCSQDVKALLDTINGDIDQLFSLVQSETPEL